MNTKLKYLNALLAFGLFTVSLQIAFAPLLYFITVMAISFLVDDQISDSAERSSSVRCVCAWYADSHRFDHHVWQHCFVEIGLEK